MATGFSTTLINERIAAGTFVKPVRIPSHRMCFWPAHEIDAMNRAIVAGTNDDELRVLVSQLEAARAHSQS